MIGLIVAYAKNRVIGNKGKIPWNIPGEQSRFRELTTGNTIIMGRRTYEEIGRPLPNRHTIVVSTTRIFEGGNLSCARSLQEAIAKAPTEKIYVSGGASLYEEALPLVDEMYITEIDLEVEGDTFFPEFEMTDFIKTDCQQVHGDVEYRYVTYCRRV